jgi:hypothetical protein
VRNLSISGAREDDFLQGADDVGEAFSDSDALRKHVNLSLYCIDAPGYLQARLQRAWYWALGDLLQESRSHHDTPLDLAAPMTAEMYMETRIAPLTKYYNNWAKSAASVRTKMNLIVFAFLAVGSLLAAFGVSLWIPVIVCGATFTSSFLRWLSPPDVLTAINTALTILNNLDLRWHGSTLKEQRSEAMRNRLIRESERAVLMVATALSRAPLLPDEDEDAQEDHHSAFDDDCKTMSGTSTPMAQAWSQSRQRSGMTTPSKQYRSGGSWM